MPAKHEPGSISVTSERDVRSTRLSTRFQKMADFANQPMILVGVEEMLVGDDLGRIARRLEDDGGDVEFVEPDVEDRIVEFARELERPELGAERRPWRQPTPAAARPVRAA